VDYIRPIISSKRREKVPQSYSLRWVKGEKKKGNSSPALGGKKKKKVTVLLLTISVVGITGLRKKTSCSMSIPFSIMNSSFIIYKGGKGKDREKKEGSAPGGPRG